MNEIEKKNILDFLPDTHRLIQSGHQEYNGNKLIFKNLFFSSSMSMKINQGHKIIIGEQDVTLHGALDFIFVNCTFEGSLNINILYFNLELRDCDVNELNLNNIKSDSHNPRHMKFIISTIRNIAIKNCSFTDRFYINPQYWDEPEYITRIDNLLIQDTVFGHNFKLHNCEVKKCNINNTDFEKNADFFKSKFLQSDDLLFKSLNFRGLALFGECEFKSTLRLEYVTFEGLSHFRQARFRKGLDLDKANIEKEMNFYDAKGLKNKESKELTSQETYRIIKHNFFKIGNQIEANKFHSIELEKRQTFLSERKKKFFFEWLVFKVHWLSSKFATNWVLPLFWIVCMGALTNEYLNYGVYKPFTFDYEFSLDLFLDFWNKTAHYMSIVSDDDPLKETPWLFLVNKVGLGYLYYQFVSAIRKDTKQS